MSDEGPPIGIDLGTTNSCVAVVVDNEVTVILTDEGKRTIPSVVFFNNIENFLVGNLAAENKFKNLKKFVYDVKRFIGRNFEEFQNEKFFTTFPYTVVNKDNRPNVMIKHNTTTSYYIPEEISAIILRKLKEQAEQVLGKKLTKAVITVPAHFNGTQRQATIDAGEIAGLNVLCIINEPTAAALAFESDIKYCRTDCNVLVYDFGGGTFDVSIVNINKGKIDVKASNGEPFLGGEDLNNNLVEYFIKHCQNHYKIDLDKCCKVMERFRQLAENTKIILSSALECVAEFDCLDDDVNFECKVSREIFVKLNKELFNKTLQCVKKSLSDANMTKDDIHEILLVGGTTRIPFVKNLVKEYFNKEPNASVHPDEAVAIGAARYAALFDGKGNKKTQIKISDVCSLSLGVKVAGDIMYIIVPRNTKLPVKIMRKFRTAEDHGTSIEIYIYEGERSMVADNKLLAMFELTGIRAAPKGEVSVDILFEIDENGILTATAVESETDNSSKLVVNIYKNNLGEDEIKEMILRAERYHKEDQERKNIAHHRNCLESKCYYIKNKALKTTNMSAKEKDLILNLSKDTINWLSVNSNLSSGSIEDKIQIIDAQIVSFSNKYL